MLSPRHLTAAEAARLILSKALSAEALAEDCADAIEAGEPDLKAWAYFDRKSFLARACEADRRLAAGEASGALFGVPIGVKDIFNTIDMPTAMGSPIWKGFTPGNDSRAVFNLKRAGAIMAGKTVTAEFAVHAPGPTRNPRDHSRIPGTSSSGSAVAVAAEMVPCAIGTQTAGSVIRPASYCGVFGYKPSFGLIPRTGMLKTTDSLDAVGFFSRSVEDLELMLEALRVHGLDYPISHQRLAEPSLRNKRGSKWKVALVRHPKWGLAEGYAKKAIEDYSSALSREADMDISAHELPAIFSEAHEIHSMIYNKSISYYFKNEYRDRTLISQEIRTMIENGNTISPEQFHGALRRQASLSAEMDRFLSEWDAIFTLSTAGEPPLVGTNEKDDSCLLWTLCGLPAINLPLLKGPAGLPIGIQVTTSRYADYRLLQFAERIAGKKSLNLQHQNQTEIIH